MGALIAAFYDVDSDRPVIEAYSDPQSRPWNALSEALANHYGEAAESFRTAEAWWNGGDEYAEIVTLNNRIIGAVNRPISTADVVAIGRDRVMQKRAFINRIRSLSNIEGHQLPELTLQQQREFVRDPLRYFLNADEGQSDALMREIEKRQIDVLSIPLNADIEAQPPRPKASKARNAKQRGDGQRELLLPLAGGNSEGNRAAKAPPAGRKAG